MGSQDESKYDYTLSYFADGAVVPDLMTEEEVIKFLRIGVRISGSLIKADGISDGTCNVLVNMQNVKNSPIPNKFR